MTVIKFKTHRVSRAHWMSSPSARDNLRPSRGVVMSIALGAAIWSLLIYTVMLISGFSH